MISVYFIKVIVSPILISVMVVGQYEDRASEDIDKIIEDAQFRLDRPMKSDLDTYLEALEDIMKFYEIAKTDIDMNIKFGLFLAKANLEKAIRRPRLPKDVHSKIVPVIQLTDNLISYFDYMVRNDYNPKDKLNKIVTTLYTNVTQWISEIKEFDTLHFKPPEDSSYEDFKKLFIDWPTYSEKVNNLTFSIPSPGLSDFCMEALGASPVHYNSPGSKCAVPDTCMRMLLNGTNYGYSLTHRTLFLLQARFGRLCSIISPKKDKDLVRTFCRASYREAEYIVMNNYGEFDLLLEQMCLCSLNGHMEFIRRSWLSDILLFQGIYGCFTYTTKHHLDVRPLEERLGNHEWKIDKQRQHNLIGGLCNGHLTTVAAATISFAIRYIMEAYY